MIAVVALLLFGAGRIADIGKGLGQGIKNFKQGLREADQIDGEKPAGQLGTGDTSAAAGKRPARRRRPQTGLRFWPATLRRAA